MRFDDSLKTVLSADMATGFGAQSAWRQLVDLIGRGRVAPEDAALARLRALRDVVPIEVRAASGRALAFAAPPAPLVALFAEDELAVAAPVLRTAMLAPGEWTTILPRLTPQGRALLRHRRDLADAVVQALEGFTAADFVLEHDAGPAAVVPAEPSIAADISASSLADAAPVPTPVPTIDPVVIDLHPAPALAPADLEQPVASDLATAPEGGFRIADVVARIDAFQRQREEHDALDLPEPPSVTGDAGTVFHFETDATGVVRAVEGVTRTALVGVSLAVAGLQGVVGIDGALAGALRQRQRFAGVRLEIGGRSEIAGSWRVAGTPLFDQATGRFTGYTGIARRPRRDEDAVVAAAPSPRAGASDALRQLVHELRTPANAIAGFAELIEAQLLGPVSPTYRDHAATIQAQATRLLGAIEDLDTAARIEGGALELRPGAVPIEALVTRVARDLGTLAELRGTGFDIHPMDDHAAWVDDRAFERLLSRLLAALTAAAGPGERVDIAEAPAPAGQVALCFARPQALGALADDQLLAIDADGAEGQGEDTPLLGTGFALRLARNLAIELGGELLFGEHLLTLRLPAAHDGGVGQAVN